MRASGYDAVVVGAGHQGLIAAIRLAEAGRRVVVLEAASAPGGAVKSAELFEAEGIHDLYATNIGLLLASPLVLERQDRLAAHGLRVAHTDAAFANAFPDGSCLAIRADRNANLEALGAHSPADAEAWKELEDLLAMYGPILSALLTNEMPSAGGLAAVTRAWLKSRRPSFAGLAQLLLSSTREVAERYFSTAEAGALLGCWGMHLDCPPDAAGGAVFPLLQMFGAQEQGMAIAAGGASTVITALVGYLTELGAELVTDADVVRITSGPRGVTGVVLADGRTVSARTVIATVTPRAAFGGLIPDKGLPRDVVLAARRYRFGPASFMVHLLLDGPIPWRAAELSDFCYVHLGPYIDDLASTFQQAAAGLLPDDPMLCIGQTSTVDPSRSRGGRHVVWIQVRCVPTAIKGDAAHEIPGRQWDEVKHDYASRVLAKLERHAPGVLTKVLGIESFSPIDLERANPNLVGGDPLAGSCSPTQMVGLRPFPHTARYRTPLRGFYLSGAATWPGPGLNGLAGELAARRALRDERRRRVVRIGFG